MTVESTAKFTDLAVKLWATLALDTKNRLLANACGRTCPHGVSITDFTGLSK